MFKSNGRKTYEQCANKRLEPGSDSAQAVLHCAVTSEEGFPIQNNTSQSLLEFVAKSAGRAMCGGCQFSGMTGEDLVMRRTREAELRCLQLEAERRLWQLQQQVREETGQ
ncbi:MAG TPA: hypothetical protein VLE73_04095 [Candidatus Saccharimonadales bacterium]|nr:hypothetical protein [Candidatus Saccharimonadales bacterium]